MKHDMLLLLHRRPGAVKIDKTSNEASIFAAQSAEEFCWMWTNGTSDAVVVQGELIRIK